MGKLGFGKIACIVAVLCAASAVGSQAQTFKTILDFDGADGAGPAALIQATDGNFYGTTVSGGANGGGTVFRVSPGGKLTTLYNFCSQTNCTDGTWPGGLVQATNGEFYGTTYYGGTSGNGTVFEITPAGKLTTLYSFCSQTLCTDGFGPDTLVQGANGDFYGTTYKGGASSFGGTVFEITAAGKFSTLYSFCS